MSDKDEVMSEGEFVEADELLASIPVSAEAMDLSEADGFMTALQLLEEPVETKEWIARVFSTVGKKDVSTGSAQGDKRLRALLLKRFKQIGSQLRSSVPLDPVYFDAEDDKGRPLKGKAAISALEPFALGFLEGAQSRSGILDSDSRQIARSLHGILRHLPKEAIGDFAKTKEILDKEAPLDDLPSALSDMVSCLAEIAFETKGYPLPELNEPESGEEKA